METNSKHLSLAKPLPLPLPLTWVFIFSCHCHFFTLLANKLLTRCCRFLDVFYSKNKNKRISKNKKNFYWQMILNTKEIKMLFNNKLHIQQNKAISKWFKCQTGSPPADNEEGALVRVLCNLKHFLNTEPTQPLVPRRYKTHLRTSSIVLVVC